MPSCLEQFLHIIEPHAKKYNFEVRIVNNLIKISPTGMHTRIFLALSPRCQDKSMEYTAKVINNPDESFERGSTKTFHKIVNYLKKNSSNAQRVIEENANRIANRMEYAPPRAQCNCCDGHGRWQEGSAEYGDQHFKLCHQCRGAGYVTVDI